MWQFFGMASLVLGGATYFLWNQNLELQGEIAVRMTQLETQKIAFQHLQEQKAIQDAAVKDLTKKSNEIQVEMNRYLDIFARHNLTKLASAKPGLIEKRANNATKQVFDSIEDDSRDVDTLNDGVQLVPEETSSGNNNETGTGGDPAAGTSEGDRPQGT